MIAAKSAVQQGAGAVFLYAPKKLLPAYENTLPDIIKIPLGEENDTFYRTPHQQKIFGKLEKSPVVLLRVPGKETTLATMIVLKTILTHYTDPVMMVQKSLNFCMIS